MEYELETLGDFTDFVPKDKRDIKRNINIVQEDVGVYAYVVAVPRDSHQDEYVTIPASFGEPIGNRCYDIVRDSFYIRGSSFHAIGFVPVNYKLLMNDVGWSVDVPLPVSVLKRYMSEAQEKEFKDWKSNFRYHNFDFLQVLNVF